EERRHRRAEPMEQRLLRPRYREEREPDGIEPLYRILEAGNERLPEEHHHAEDIQAVPRRRYRAADGEHEGAAEVQHHQQNVDHVLTRTNPAIPPSMDYRREMRIKPRTRPASRRSASQLLFRVSDG